MRFYAGAWERARQLVVLDHNNVGVPQDLTRIDRYKGIAHELPAEYDPERGIGAVGGSDLVSIGLAVAGAPILLFVYRILFRK